MYFDCKQFIVQNVRPRTGDKSYKNLAVKASSKQRKKAVWLSRSPVQVFVQYFRNVRRWLTFMERVWRIFAHISLLK